MKEITETLLSFLLLLLFLYAFFFGNPTTPSSSPIPHFFQRRLPSYLMHHLKMHVGDENAEKLVSSIHYLQIVYLGVVLGCWSIMFAYGYPLIETSLHVSNYHQYVGYGVFMLCIKSWRLACKVPPGFITENNIPKFDNYPYDNLLYTNKLCPTVKIRKLARSKYDRISKRHVAKFDHFCGWLNQAVGEENYRYFLFFLIVHTVMCTYGSIITALLFRGEIIDKNLLNARFYNAITGEEVKANQKMVVFRYIISAHYYLARVLLVMVVVAVALCLFLGFHLYITARGMTTNEYFKWKEVRRWYGECKRNYETAVKEGKVVVVDVAVAERDDSGSAVGGGGEKSEGSGDDDLGDMMQQNKTSEKNDSNNNNSKEEEEEVIIIDPGPFPKNIYDNGIIENFKEVLYPKSLRQDAIQRFEEWNRAEEEEERKQIKRRRKRHDYEKKRI